MEENEAHEMTPSATAATSQLHKCAFISSFWILTFPSVFMMTYFQKSTEPWYIDGDIGNAGQRS